METSEKNIKPKKKGKNSRLAWSEEYSQALATVSRRLTLITAVLLLATSLLFVPVLFLEKKFGMSWFSLGVGVLGGFVSIQQRLKNIHHEELVHLARHWIFVLTVPLFSGISGLVMYVLLLSGIVEGPLFPAFSVAEFSDTVTPDDLKVYFAETYPASGDDFAKLGIWTFVAGFSERLVPSAMSNLVNNASGTILDDE